MKITDLGATRLIVTALRRTSNTDGESPDISLRDQDLMKKLAEAIEAMPEPYDWEGADMAELQALCDSATPGPWTAYPNPMRDDGMFVGFGKPTMETVHRLTGPIEYPRYPGGISSQLAPGNARFIAAAREAMPAALAEIERLQTLVAANAAAAVESGQLFTRRKQQVQHLKLLLRECLPFIETDTSLEARILDELREE